MLYLIRYSFNLKEIYMKALTSVTFYIMLYLRKIFFRLSKLINFLLILPGLFLLFVTHQYGMGITLVLLSFGIFMVRNFYDHILLKINPTGRTFILSD